MSTTTVRLPNEEEQRRDFHDAAEKRYSRISASGKAVRWSEMRAYVENRVAGKKVRRPVAKIIARWKDE